MTDQVNQGVGNQGGAGRVNVHLDTFEEFKLYTSLSQEVDVDWDELGIYDIKEEQEVMDINSFSDREILRLAKRGDLPDNFIFGFLGSERSAEMKRKMLRSAVKRMDVKYLNYIALQGDSLPMEVRVQVLFSGKLSERVIQYLLKQMKDEDLAKLDEFMVARSGVEAEYDDAVKNEKKRRKKEQEKKEAD